MDGLNFLAKAYLPQMVGFALTLFGMQILLTADVSRLSVQTTWILFGLLVGWIAAVFGSLNFFSFLQREKERTPVDPLKVKEVTLRVYWPGLVIYAIACAIPICVNAFDHGWTERNALGVQIAVGAILVGCAKGLWDRRERLRKR